MKIKGIFLSIMAIILSCVMANAKLAIAFANGNEDGDFADVQTVAKIRCAMIEANGKDWFDEFVKDNLFIRSLLNVYVGKKSELVLDVLQAPNFNEDTLGGLRRRLIFLPTEMIHCIFVLPAKTFPIQKLYRKSHRDIPSTGLRLEN